MPRMRPTMRSGWNGSSASYFSPTPMNLIGCPVTLRMESAAPPRASPSILVRTTPVSVSFLWNSSAERTASWPVMESATKRISCGFRIFFSDCISSINCSSMCRRPAVSTISTSQRVVDGFAARFFHQPLDGRGVGFLDLAFVEVGLDGLRDYLQLLARGGTIDVNRDQHGPMSALLEPVRQLARGGGLTGTLQAGHQHDRRRLRGELQLGRVFAQDVDQFVADDLDHLLGRRERGQNFLADSLLADVVDEFLDDLEVDVGFQQRHADFFERFADVFFGQRALSAQVLKCTLQFICKVFKHCQESKLAGYARTALSLSISRRH